MIAHLSTVCLVAYLISAFPSFLELEAEFFSKQINLSWSMQQETVSQINDEANCTEDRVEAIEVGRQCSRRCKKDVPCENARKQCLCDGLCGLSCLKPDLSCVELPKIANGDYQPKSSRLNGRVVYQCSPGYYLFGSHERLCQGDEEWSGTAAECLAEPQCGNPIKVNHARNPSDRTYQLEDKINYSCYPGYLSRGSSEASCKLINRNQTAWVWEGDPFRCMPKSCGDPGHIENGFEMIGQARRYCQSDNQWSGHQPQCEPVACNPTDHLENGKINYAHPLAYNSTVEYSCDFGFQLIGLQRRRCGPERKLMGEVPICKEIDCGELGPLDNGYIRGYSTRMGDKKEFTCRVGMKFVGNSSQSVCLDSGHWSHPLPMCLAPCKVPFVKFANKTYTISSDMIERRVQDSAIALKEVDAGTMASHGSFLEIVCDNHYEFETEMDEHNLIQAPLCKNSTWSYEAKCKPASCHSSPHTPRNGRIRVLSIEHGSKGFVHCLDGYRLRGANSTQCINGDWSKINSTCLEIFCSFPGNLKHGRVLLIGLTGMYDYKPYIKRISTNRQIAYECDAGYRLNDGAPGGATCMDGQWKPDGLPNCIKE